LLYGRLSDAVGGCVGDSAGGGGGLSLVYAPAG
jgi:hypothetical protein